MRLAASNAPCSNGSARALARMKVARSARPQRSVKALATCTEALSQVDARDSAAMCLDEVPRRAADTRADIEHMHALGEAQLAGELDGRGQPAQMEFVDGGQIGRGELADVLAARLEARQDCLL